MYSGTCGGVSKKVVVFFLIRYQLHCSDPKGVIRVDDCIHRISDPKDRGRTFTQKEAKMYFDEFCKEKKRSMSHHRNSQIEDRYDNFELVRIETTTKETIVR